MLKDSYKNYKVKIVTKELHTECPECKSVEQFLFLPNITSVPEKNGRLNITEWKCDNCKIIFTKTERKEKEKHSKPIKKCDVCKKEVQPHPNNPKIYNGFNDVASQMFICWDCAKKRKRHKFRISFKWFKNDSGGDIITLCIDYFNEADKKKQVTKILKDYQTKPIDFGNHKGQIPYSVSNTISSYN